MTGDRQINWSSQAEHDLAEIWSYLASVASQDTADLQLKAIDAALGTLKEWPLAGRPRDELLPGVRSFTMPPFVIFYRNTQVSSEIVRVLHARRDVDALFSSQRSSQDGN